MRNELLKGLTDEQVKKVKACKSSQEILELAKSEGVELNEEQLEAVSGGGCGSTHKCPMCGSTNIKMKTEDVTLKSTGTAIKVYVCKDCKHMWGVH